MKKKNSKKPSIFKVVLIFMILCIVCSFVLNIFLYRRITMLQKEIKALNDRAAITQEQYTQEVSYEFI